MYQVRITTCLELGHRGFLNHFAIIVRHLPAFDTRLYTSHKIWPSINYSSVFAPEVIESAFCLKSLETVGEQSSSFHDSNPKPIPIHQPSSSRRCAGMLCWPSTRKTKRAIDHDEIGTKVDEEGVPKISICYLKGSFIGPVNFWQLHELCTTLAQDSEALNQCARRVIW